jgi:6-phosphogluconolactonase
MEIEVMPDSASLAERAAEGFIHLADEAFQKENCFTIALAGGSTPRLVYKRLVAAQVDMAAAAKLSL